jgi:hypothetical protein
LEGEEHINKNLEFKLKINHKINNSEINCNFVIRIISLKNLIAETRTNLFTERNNLENFKNFMDLYKEPKQEIKSFYKKLIFNKFKKIYGRPYYNKANELFRSAFVFNTYLSFNDISTQFRKNKITISTGMNNQKGILSPLDFKFSCLFKSLFGEKLAYKYILSSNNLDKKTYKGAPPALAGSKTPPFLANGAKGKHFHLKVGEGEGVNFDNIQIEPFEEATPKLTYYLSLEIIDNEYIVRDINNNNINNNNINSNYSNSNDSTNFKKSNLSNDLNDLNESNIKNNKIK